MAKPKLRDARVVRIHEAIERVEADAGTRTRRGRKKPAVAPVTESRGIIVLGMHRAGTSAVAKILVNLGFEIPGEPVPAKPDNPRGYWEPREIVEVHDEFFHHIGRSWSDPRPLPRSLFQDGGTATVKERLREVLRRLVIPRKRWVIKDPRMCRLMPLWQEVLEAEKLSCRVLHILRSPLAVADSLEKRDRFSREKGLLLWLRHSLEAEAATRGQGRSWLHFEELTASPPAHVLQGLRSATGSPRLAKTRIQNAIGDALDPSLVHHHHGFRETLERLAAHPWVADAYRAFASLCTGSDSTAEETLDKVRSAIRQADALLLGNPERREVELYGERFLRLKHSIDSQRQEIEIQRAEVGALRELFDEERERHEGILQVIAGHDRASERRHEDIAAALAAVEAQRQQLDGLQESLTRVIQDLMVGVAQPREMAESLRLLEAQRQQLDALGESVGRVAESQVAAEEPRRRLAESLHLLEAQHDKLDVLGESVGRLERHEIAAEEQRRGLLDSQRRRLDALGESMGRVAERQMAAEEPWRRIAESLSTLDAQHRKLDALGESVGGLIERQTGAADQLREIAESLSALPGQRDQLGALRESLGGLAERQATAEEQRHQIAESLSAVEAQSQLLDTVRESLAGQNQQSASLAERVSAIETLITERLENRHLALLSKVLEVAAQMESEWQSAREQLREAAGERDALREEHDAAIQQRDHERALAVAERDEILGKLARAQAQLATVRCERDSAQAEISQLQQRFSWRITAPLRAVLALFKGRRS